jgi:predicted nucleotide-binding protein
MINKKEVFIVHGHDEAAKTKTARFIEQLELKPIILHEQASGSKTVIEKIEAYSNVGFGIVLYTPCDLGAKAEENPIYKNRARQNVVFEHGFLIGKIGRANVCALVKDEVETPNDISGVVYIKMDSEDAWHLKIARELRNSGYEIDMNKL